LKTKETTWARLLAYATGLVNQELLLQNEYLAAENGILRAHLRGLRLSDGERATLAEIVKEECLSELILFGEASLRRALTQFQEHYHSERNHQGKGNVRLFPRADELPKRTGSSIQCRERLGGLLKYYHRRAA
jgi:hypothetical protein